MITMIVAAARDGAIGKDGKLLWCLSGDLRRFKELTVGHTVIMGRKTWESLPKRPLPDRRNVVITSNPDYEAAGATIAGSLTDAVSKARSHPHFDGEIFIIGGERVYRDAMKIADAIDLTLVDASFPDADAWFALPSEDEWILKEESPVFSVDKSGLSYRHTILMKNEGGNHK